MAAGARGISMGILNRLHITHNSFCINNQEVDQNPVYLATPKNCLLQAMALLPTCQTMIFVDS